MRSDDHYLLIRKLKPEWQKGRINGIGGKIEPGEGAYKAIAREFEEETGIGSAQSHWKMTIILQHNNWKVYFFIYTGDAKIEDARQMEAEELVVMTWDMIAKSENVIPNLKWLIPLSYDEDIDKPITITDRGVN